MKPENIDESKLLEYNSWRHHYIPRFILNAFTNSEGFFYVYDKQKDEILKGAKSPKQYFFERDKNTIEGRDGEKSSMLEDVIYQKLDNDCSKTLKHFQEEELNKINFSTENTAHFLFFLVNLFWRIPATDYSADDVMNNSEILSSSIDPEVLKNDPTFRKLERAALFKHHIDEIVKLKAKGKKSVQIHHSNTPILVIGDYPILFRKAPTIFGEFDQIDSFMAISSNRIYSSSNKTFQPLTLSSKATYNAAVIHQSERYAAAGDLRVLEASVQFYRSLKSEGLEKIIIQQFFNELSYAN